ncbi:GNAT family N-acetyltransferase [Enterococcus sp. LJL99]
MTIRLNQMKNIEYTDYLSFAISDYAKDKIEAGTWEAAEALSLAKKSFATLLPEGNETKNEFLFTLFDEKIEKSIGYLWVHLEKELNRRKFFIYDFLIFEDFRNQGYGRKALNCLDSKAKEMNVTEIGLHVFAHNKSAVHLYESVGFQPTDITMSKKV